MARDREPYVCAQKAAENIPGDTAARQKRSGLLDRPAKFYPFASSYRFFHFGAAVFAMATKGLAIMSNVCTINDVRAL